MADASPDVSTRREREGVGPGRFVMVVGPSGAGKDSLIRAAREAFAGDDHYVFPRRQVTRPASEAEDNAEITAQNFERLRREGAFAVSWTAHGLGYGIAEDVDDDIRRGRTVVCNVSRSVVADLRLRYANALVIEVTAPPDILRSRLSARGRSDDGSLDMRLARVAPDRENLKPDAVVSNSGALDEAAAAFLQVLR